MKIDVEGVELEVLKGGIQTLQDKVNGIILEVSFVRKGRKSDNYIKIFEFLNKCNFYLRDIYGIKRKIVGNKSIINEIDCVFKKYKK